MVRVRSGQSKQRFDRIQPVNRVGWLLDFAALGEPADVEVSVLFAADKITVERNNRLRFVEFEVGLGRFAERDRRRLAMDIEIHRLVNEPARFREFIADQLPQPRARRGTAALQQETQSLAAIRLGFLRQLAQKIQRRLALHDIAVPDEPHRAVGIVNVQDGGLRIVVRGAVAVRVQRVAFDLRRSAVIRFDDQRNGAAARRHRGREELRRTVDVIFRRFAERQNLFLRAAAPTQPKPREQE